MPEPLREYQYELSALSGGEGFVFGTEDTGYLTLTRPQHLSGETSNNDAPRPYEDGTIFSIDFQGGKSVAFEIGVLTDQANLAISNGGNAHGTNLDYLEAIEGWWTDPVWRNGAKAMAMLRACEGGRTSRAYGRPRRYDEATSNLTRLGYSTVVCDFQMVDGNWYSDTEGVVEVSMLAPPDGGLIAPLVAPITTVPESENRQAIAIGGARPTWPVIEFVGPVTNPSVQIGNLQIGITGSVAWDQKVVIDPRPWVRTALRSGDGANFAGKLSRATPRMADMKIKPGTYDVTFRGVDQSGSSRCRVRWRDARKRP